MRHHTGHKRFSLSKLIAGTSRPAQLKGPSRRPTRFEPLEGRMMLTVGGPGFPFVDANNDGLFNAGDGDVLLNNGELSDGKFDTAVAEGPNYTTPVAGAGLVIDGAAITVTGNINYKASGTLIVNTNLTAGDDLKLTSRTASVKLDDPTLTATDDIIIVARVDITGLSDTLSAGGDIY